MSPTTGKWIWIELIAFDTTAPDLGVAAVLDPLGERPSVLSLLLYSAEFVHTHDAVDDELLPVECTAYYARSWSVRGPRQDWTRAQLRALVSALRDRGIAVFFALFDMHAFEDGATTRVSAWNEAHPELTVVDRAGAERTGLLNPLGRFADGSFYEDFFATRLEEVFAYYGFDGLHGADGYSSGRLPLWEADFSADLLEQFSQWSGVVVPDAAVSAQADWIWRHARSPWIRFHAHRWTRFWTTVCASVHGAGGRVVLNNAWTRDPFEALYRYGVDYRGLAAAGIDGLVLETVAAAVELLERPPALPPLPGQLGAALLTGATIPDVPLAALVSVHDTLEGWDVINVAPGMHERDVRLLSALRRFTGAGDETIACVGAGLYCLSDGVAEQQWRWMDGVRESCATGPRPGSDGITVLYDPEIIEGELASFVSTRAAHTHALLAELIRAGAPITAVSPMAAHEAVAGPVLLLRPELYPPEVVDAVLARHPAALTLGSSGGRGWRLRELDGGAVRDEIVADGPDDVAVDGGEDHDSWVHELRMAMPPRSLIDRLADVAATAIGQRRPAEADRVVCLVLTESEHVSRVVFSNPAATYRDGVVTLPRPVRRATRLTGVTPRPPRVDGPVVVARVPPRGVVELRVELATG
ncbi:hypothetical protein [Jiangella muralis]|uniref:hypothetical protein n=1 Tax=Jiangella muralis TaxID=702383 RepID=UPI00069CC3A8|nr:hypothetical protein [Jiangella muralis]